MGASSQEAYPRARGVRERARGERERARGEKERERMGSVKGAAWKASEEPALLAAMCLKLSATGRWAVVAGMLGLRSGGACARHARKMSTRKGRRWTTGTVQGGLEVFGAGGCMRG